MCLPWRGTWKISSLGVVKIGLTFLAKLGPPGVITNIPNVSITTFYCDASEATTGYWSTFNMVNFIKKYSVWVKKDGYNRSDIITTHIYSDTVPIYKLVEYAHKMVRGDRFQPVSPVIISVNQRMPESFLFFSYGSLTSVELAYPG